MSIKEMKILMVSASISRRAGGLFHSVRRLSQHLGTVCQVQVAALRDEFSATDATVWRPLSLDLFDCIGPSGWGYSPHLRAWIGTRRPDVVHACGLWVYPSAAAGSISRHEKRLLVVSPRGMLDPWALRNSRWKKRIAGWLYENRNLRSAACIHALCESEYESIRAYGLKNPVAIIPNGIDLPPKRISCRVFEGDRGTSARKTMLFLGRLHPKKGLSQLIQAWGRVRCPKWELLIAGWDDGGHEDGLKKLVTELDLCSSVQFVGPQFGNAKDCLLRSVDAFVLPSFSEGLPMSVLEAWSYSLPVLMTPQCNIPEGFRAHAAVKILPKVSSIAQGLDTFFSMSDSEQSSLGLNGCRLVESHFTWPQVAHQMVSVYRWLLGRCEKPDCVRLD